LSIDKLISLGYYLPNITNAHLEFSAQGGNFLKRKKFYGFTGKADLGPPLKNRPGSF
jgi:hypothetical protein